MTSEVLLDVSSHCPTCASTDRAKRPRRTLRIEQRKANVLQMASHISVARGQFAQQRGLLEHPLETPQK